MKHLQEPARAVPIVEDVDVAVIGGGPAGMHAALASARLGASTVLVERYGFMGGNATNALVGPLLGVYHWGDGRLLLGGTPLEMLRRMEKLGGALLHEAGFHVPFDPEVMKFVADEMIAQAGVRLHLHSFAARPLMRDRRIEALFTESKSGRQAIRAKVFVDCTGDGDLAVQAGAPFEMGRSGDGSLQPLTLSYRLGNIDLSKLENIYNTKAGYVATNVRAAMQRAVEAGELPVFGGPWLMKGSTVRDNEAFVNMVRVWGNGASAEELTRLEMQGRSHMMQFVAFLRANIPGCERTFLMDSGPQIGVRETRRIVGQYVLTENDIVEDRRFDDAVALGCHPIDIHSPTGTVAQRLQEVPAYQIPYRTLVPKGVENLLVAGRPISATHEAHSSLRVMGTCMALGLGAGAAAALAARGNGAPNDIPAASLREALAAVGAVTE